MDFRISLGNRIGLGCLVEVKRGAEAGIRSAGVEESRHHVYTSDRPMHILPQRDRVRGSDWSWMLLDAFAYPTRH